MTMTSASTGAPSRQDNVLRLTDRRMLGYAEYGDPAGAAVFAFHGFPGSRLEFRLADERARARGVHIVAPDRPGMGLSSFKPKRKLIDWPDDVVELADALGIGRFAVLGVSGGGPYAAACAWKIASRVTAAAIVSGIGPMELPDATDGMLPTNRLMFRAQRRVPPAGRVIVWLMGTMLKRAGDQGMERFLRALPEPDQRVLSRPEVRQLFRDDGSEAFRGGARGPALENGIYVRPWGFRLADIRVPVHVWQGGADRNVPPAHGRAQAAAIPGATLHFYEEEGHMLVIDRIDEILEAITSRG